MVDYEDIRQKFEGLVVADAKQTRELVQRTRDALTKELKSREDIERYLEMFPVLAFREQLESEPVIEHRSYVNALNYALEAVADCFDVPFEKLEPRLDYDGDHPVKKFLKQRLAKYEN